MGPRAENMKTFGAILSSPGPLLPKEFNHLKHTQTEKHAPQSLGVGEFFIPHNVSATPKGSAIRADGSKLGMDNVTV